MTDILPPAGWPNVRQLETNEFATGGPNGNMNEQAKSLAARSELLKQYAALPYESKTGGYALNERVQLATGDIVRSTIPSNVNNPNSNMTGWVNPKAEQDVINNAVREITKGGTGASTTNEARTNLDVYSKSEVEAMIEAQGVTPVEKGGTGAATIDLARENLSVYSRAEVDDKFTESSQLSKWVDVKNYRVLNTYYTNPYNHDLFILVAGSILAGTNVRMPITLFITDDSGADYYIDFASDFSSTATSLTCQTRALLIVPAKARYKIQIINASNRTFYDWWEKQDV